MRSLAFLVLSSALVQNIRALPVAEDINQVNIKVIIIVVVNIIIDIMVINHYLHQGYYQNNCYQSQMDSEDDAIRVIIKDHQSHDHNPDDDHHSHRLFHPCYHAGY